MQAQKNITLISLMMQSMHHIVSIIPRKGEKSYHIRALPDLEKIIV